MTRTDQAKLFLESAGWADAQIAPLAGDASNRKYERLTLADGSRAVLMDAPPQKGEDVQPFVTIAQYLCGIGLSAPRIFHQNVEHGFLLIEDLGDRLYAREIVKNPSSERMLYEAAVDVLTQAHKAPPPALPSYNAETTVPLAALSFDWYQFGATGSVDETAKAAFTSAFSAKIAPLDTAPHVLIQRDYHAENLLWLPDRQGAARVGLLDFQDAMLGHPAYDLVSILQDARRDVPPEIEAAMKQRFVIQNGLEVEEFSTAYAILGLQRNLRILGVFARLCLRDGKAHYVDLLPRVWAHVQTNLRHPALADIALQLNTALPEPSASVLATLKSKCAQ